MPRRFPQRVEASFAQLTAAAQGAALGVTLMVITTLGPQGVAPFIYFRF